MPAAKIAITIDSRLLRRVDQLVVSEHIPSRSRAIQLAVEEKIQRHDRSRLARECAKLNPHEEQAMAEVGYSTEVSQWPEY
jgi:metal-responsive CopG/Arc/MetJ family transcriptional regulator